MRGTFLMRWQASGWGSPLENPMTAPMPAGLTVAFLSLELKPRDRKVNLLAVCKFLSLSGFFLRWTS